MTSRRSGDRLKKAISNKDNSELKKRFSITIKNQDAENVGELICVDRVLASDVSVVRDLTEWRKRFMKFFLTQFEATPERTKSWLEKVVLPSDDRLFFLICLPNGDAIGNFGICNLRPTSGELDNLIRGKNGGGPNLIFLSELAILSWMFGDLEYEKANLHVFSNNRPTIKLHTSVGFEISNSTPLSRLTSDESIEYLQNSEKGEPVKFNYLELTLKRESFLKLHPWVCNVYADFF